MESEDRMDALTLLTADHNRVRGLAARFEAAHEREDVETMTTLAARLFEELEVHTKIEEDVFYPAVEGASDELRDLVVEGLEEHHVVDQLMAEARALQPEDEHWAAKVKVMIENVEHHAEEEESQMFPAVRSAMSEEKLTALAERLEARKRELGAPTMADTIDLSKEELMEKAREQEIPGRSKMSREELAATVSPR
jgi:hemerythrin superfamily protein